MKKIRLILIMLIGFINVSIAAEWKRVDTKDNVIYTISDEKDNRITSVEFVCSKGTQKNVHIDMFRKDLKNNSIYSGSKDGRSDKIFIKGVKDFKEYGVYQSFSIKDGYLDMSISSRNKQEATHWNKTLEYLTTTNKSFESSVPSMSNYRFTNITNNQNFLNKMREECQIDFAEQQNKKTNNNIPNKPFSVEWKENQYNRLNLQIDIHSLTDITVNNVIVNNGKCETDIWNPAGAHKGELKGKFPKDLEQYDVLEILVWNCKKMHKIEIETNYGSYFYNVN